MKQRRISGALKAVTRNRNVNTDVKKTLHNSVSLLSVLYGSEAWTFLVTKKSRFKGSEYGVPAECVCSYLEGQMIK